MNTFKLHFCAMLAASLLLTACAGQQSSVDRNASHAVAKLSSIHFDPNTRPLRADSFRWMTTFLRQFYDQGKTDRANGLTLAQAEQRVKAFSECPTGPFRPEAQLSHVASHDYSADQPEQQSRILLESATATYWDGYYGRS